MNRFVPSTGCEQIISTICNFFQIKLSWCREMLSIFRSELFLKFSCMAFPFSFRLMVSSFLIVFCGLLYAAESKDYFAVVNGETISANKFMDEFQKGIRETFFHGKVTNKELENFRKKVVKNLINEQLLLQQAKKTGLKPRPKKVEKKIEKETEQYRGQKNWEKGKAGIIASIRDKLEVEDLLDQLEEKTRKIKKPKVDAVKKYYKDNADKFTAPEKWNVSIIMLKVDPSSTSMVWQDTTELADELVQKIRNGENFEELARIHSGDESAIDGGNMGYVHTGMLSKPAQAVLNTMELGQVSEPVMLLQGVAIFRLNGVQGSRLNDFDLVKGRAQNLLYREMQDKAWDNLVVSLRKDSKIEVNEEFVKNAAAGPRPQ